MSTSLERRLTALEGVRGDMSRLVVDAPPELLAAVLDRVKDLCAPVTPEEIDLFRVGYAKVPAGGMFRPPPDWTDSHTAALSVLEWTAEAGTLNFTDEFLQLARAEFDRIRALWPAGCSDAECAEAAGYYLPGRPRWPVVCIALGLDPDGVSL